MSGLSQQFAKLSYGVNPYRGFESPPLRHFRILELKLKINIWRESDDDPKFPRSAVMACRCRLPIHDSPRAHHRSLPKRQS